MPWTTPATWTVGQVIGATDLNAQVRDNLTYLHTERPIAAIMRSNGSAYSTTSATLVDIDATNLSATLTLTTGRALCLFVASVYADATPRLLSFDFAMDGVNFGAVVKHAYPGYTNAVSLAAIKTGISVGSHTFRVRWAIDLGTAYLHSDSSSKVNLIVMEV